MNPQQQKLKNPLLLKQYQGKVKQTAYILPEQKHTYGKKVIDDPHPIKNVVNGWNQAQQSATQQSKQKNYQALNKISVISGAITAKTQQQFRKTTNIMVEPKKGQKVMPIMLPQQQFVYGVPNRPSTPVKLVMGNCYGLEKQKQIGEKYMRQTQLKQIQKTKKLTATKTKSQALRQQKAKQQKQFRTKANIDQKFKLSKFTQANVTKVDTRLKPFEKSK